MTGAAIDSAVVKDQTFYLAEGAETIATIIAKSDPIPATIVSQTPDTIRYQSVWQVTLPNLNPGSTYRLWSQLNCQPKTTAAAAVTFYSPVPTKSIATPVQHAAPSILGWLGDLLSSLFGGNIFNPTNPNGVPANKTLQLRTIQPLQVYQNTCTFIKFKVGSDQVQ